MSLRKLLKLKAEFDAFDRKMQQRDLERQRIKLELQQQEFDILSLWFEMKREADQPFVLNEVDQHQEGNEIIFDLPPKFDEYEDELHEIEEEAKQREDISHSKPMGQGKICSWVINEESYAHSLANLHTFFHPHLYTLSHLHHTTPQTHHVNPTPFISFTTLLLVASNFESRACEQWNPEESEGFCPNQIQIKVNHD